MTTAPSQRCTYPQCGATSTKGYCREECRPMPPPAPERCLIDYGRMGDEFVVCETHGIPFRYQGKVRLCPIGRAIEDARADHD